MPVYVRSAVCVAALMASASTGLGQIPDQFLGGPAVSDSIRLLRTAGLDTTVALVDGWSGVRCLDDEAFYHPSDIVLPNMQPFDGPFTLHPDDLNRLAYHSRLLGMDLDTLARIYCPAEVAIFSPGDAMQLISTNSGVWTTGADEMTVELTPDAWWLSLTIWLLRDDFRDDAEEDAARAAQLYHDSRSGIEFRYRIRDGFVSGMQPDVQTQLLNAVCDGVDVPALKDRVGFDARAINIYYIDWPSGLDPANCTQGGSPAVPQCYVRAVLCDEAVILVGRESDNESLAHELGHWLSLTHVNQESAPALGLDSNNLMYTGGTDRDVFTLGQSFRANVSPTSGLNYPLTDSIRTGPVRMCADADSSRRCPPISTDATP